MMQPSKYQQGFLKGLNLLNLTIRLEIFETLKFMFSKGPFKYYVIKDVGGWGQKMAIFDDLQYCKSSKRWMGGPKKVKNMMT